MKRLFTALFICVSFLCYAQEREKAIIEKNTAGIIESIIFSNTDSIIKAPASATEYFSEYLKIEATDEFKKINQVSKRKGLVHEHFQQHYNGVKVDGVGYNFHYKNGNMYFAHGRYLKIKGINTNPTIDKNKAKESFADYKNIPLEVITDYQAELLIKEIPAKNDTILMLVYKVYLFADHKNNNETGFVDAHSGKVVMTEPSMIDFSATGTFATRYSGTRQGITHNYNGNYHLVDSTKDAIIHTWNMNGGTSINNRVELSDNDNNWTKAEHFPNNNDMGLDVHWSIQQIYNRLNNVHEINSFDDNGFAINSYIRDGRIPDNASWRPADRALFFGSGGTFFRSLASVDVVAHEFGHGITHFQIGWGTTGDQPAFNEGLSDIWAAIMESRINPNSVWQIGEQLDLNYGCLRNIQNTDDANARTQIADTYGSSQYNSGDIYVRGGVFSHWFYLLVNGGSGTNEIGNSYTVYGVGMDPAENIITETVFNNYLRNTTSYTGIRQAFVNAANSINNYFLAQQIENAWYAVGVGEKPTQLNFSGPSTVCDQSTYTIENLPQGATVQWSASGLSPNSGTGVSFTASPVNYAGVGYVRASITFGANTYTLSKDLELNGYSPIEGPDEGYISQKKAYFTMPEDIVVSQWMVNGVVMHPDTPNRLILAPLSQYYPGNVLIICTGISDCGTFTATKDFQVMDDTGGLYLIYPNPASTSFRIKQKIPENEVASDKTDNSDLSVLIYNNQSSLLGKHIVKENEPIDIHLLRDGFYIVHIIKDSKIYEAKLIIKRD
ncbi:M4 family metallopeptidase [Parabacteroides sp. Marseille-P3160]|uniref:M4 family metallopeptidase n=1 Tax=Parabacteroides sp. Marseille-P3160 TaxID=1917887 RepID=UPI0009BA64F3|nr:M4 family metallopeptidase [Parabacteroides sp. Marseille-P3160]